MSTYMLIWMCYNQGCRKVWKFGGGPPRASDMPDMCKGHIFWGPCTLKLTKIVGPLHLENEHFQVRNLKENQEKREFLVLMIFKVIMYPR